MFPLCLLVFGYNLISIMCSCSIENFFSDFSKLNFCACYLSTIIWTLCSTANSNVVFEPVFLNTFSPHAELTASSPSTSSNGNYLRSHILGDGLEMCVKIVLSQIKLVLEVLISFLFQDVSLDVA